MIHDSSRCERMELSDRKYRRESNKVESSGFGAGTGTCSHLAVKITSPVAWSEQPEIDSDSSGLEHTHRAEATAVVCSEQVDADAVGAAAVLVPHSPYSPATAPSC